MFAVALCQTLTCGNRVRIAHPRTHAAFTIKSVELVDWRLVLRPAIPFLELRIEFYEFFLRQIRMPLLSHEFPEL